MKNRIDLILQGNQRLWKQKDWFIETTDFINDSLLGVSIPKDGPGVEGCMIYRFEKEIENLDLSLKNQAKLLLVFFRTKEYKLSDMYLKNLMSNATIKSNDAILSTLYYMAACIFIEKTEYRNANEHFLISMKLNYENFDYSEKMEFFIRWSYLFIESNNTDLAEKLLINISVKLSHEYRQQNALMLYFLFVLKKKTHQNEATITYANLLLPYPLNCLDFDDWYSLHLFCGEYYSSINQDFQKAINHFSMANTFLTNKWKNLLSRASEIKHLLTNEEIIQVRDKFEENSLKFILESHLHNTHYLSTLKNAYDELEIIHKKIQESSYIDQLTNLNNRRFLWDKAKEFLTRAKKEKAPIACLIIDFDDFKKINDTYGHIEGDKVLKKGCKLIKTSFRKSDIIVRFGGEEVLCLLYNIPKDVAIELAEKVREGMENLKIMSNNDEEIRVTVSIGIAMMEKVTSNDHHLLEKMIEESDKYLYDAKSKQKNIVVYKQ